MKKVGAELKNEVVQAIVKGAEKKAWSRLFKVVWFKRWRWLVMLAPLGGCVPEVMAQSFTVDVDYQLQRQYKGPLLRHEVFTNAAELAAYVAGGAASRAYAGQVVVLVEGGEPSTYTLGMDGTNMVAHQTGGAPEDWSVYPAAADLDMGGHSVTGAADVVTAGGASLAQAAARGDSAVQTNHVGNVEIDGEFSASGAVKAGRLVSAGLYDEAGRSIPSIAVDSSVRYDVGKVWDEVEGLPRNVATWLSVAWSPKLRLFVTVGSAKAAHSADGINWTIQDLPMSYASGITWAPELGLFVVVTDSSRGVGLSQDGINWFMASVPPSGNYTAVAWSPQLRLFIAVGAYRIATSEDGLIWSTTISNSLWADICWSPERGRFVASSSGVGPRIGISEDGVNWTYPSVPDNYLLSVEWSPELGLFVAGGSRGGSYASVIVSSNGENWAEVPSAPKDSWRSIRWSPEARCFVAVSGGGRAMRSTDGYNWSMYSVPVGNALNGVEWSPSLRLFLATGGVTVKSRITGDVSVGSLAVEGSISASGGLSASGNVQLGTVNGTNTIAGDTQIGNSERRLDINQKGLAIIDAVTEDTEFAVEQYAPSQWRVDLKGNALTNAGVVSATGFMQNGTNVGALAAAALASNVWATAPGTTNYMPQTVQVLTNAALQSGINARVPTNDIRYLASLTNAAAFATKAQGVRADLALTNLPFGVTGTMAYRGDWGQSASNLAYAASTGKVDKTDTSYSRTNHGHGGITADGKLGGTAGLMVQTTTAGLLSTKPAGTTQQWLRGDGQWATAPAVGWQNPAAVSYWTYSLVPWGSEPTGSTDWANRVVVMLHSYTGPPDVVIPDYIDGHPVAILQRGGGSYDSVFTEPGSILTITAGRNLDFIGAFALTGLTNLYRLDTPGLTRLGEGAISGCTALETLHFPNTLTYLEGQSLYDLPSLQAVYWGGNMPVGGNNPFGGSTTQAVNYVTNPTATGWGTMLGTRPVVWQEATVGALTLGGVRRVEWPGHYWPAQTATYKAYKFPAGDYLFGDGNNLFYVTASGAVTNAITANP